MSCGQFETLEQAIDALDLTVVETAFFPALSAIAPSEVLTTFLIKIEISVRQLKSQLPKQSPPARTGRGFEPK